MNKVSYYLYVLLTAGFLWFQPLQAQEKSEANENSEATAEVSEDAPLPDLPQETETPFSEQYKPLLDNSPFMTQDFKQRLAGAKNRGASNITFLGYARSNGKWLINLYDKRKKEGKWVYVGDSFNNVKLTSFNEKKGELVITTSGTSLTLKLEKK